MNPRSSLTPLGTVLSLALILGLDQRSLAQVFPIITNQPSSQTVTQGANAAFTVGVASSTFVTYQWRFNLVNIAGATSASYTVFNAQVTNAGAYSVYVQNANGNTTSDNAILTVQGPPMITGQPANTNKAAGGSVTLSVTAVGPGPISYQWRFYVTNLLDGATNSTLTLNNVQAWQAGNYSVVVSNAYGATTSSSAALSVNLSAGMVGCWGNTTEPASTVPPGYVGGNQAIAAGGAHSLALKTNGVVVAWGDNSYGQATVPFGLSNVISIAAGYYHSLALLNDATVVAWGDNLYGQCDVPFGLTNVASIAAGAYHSLALLKDGTVVAWGYNFDGETDVPSNLSNVVRIAAGYYHNLALKRDGTIIGWGQTNNGECYPPPGLADAVAVSAGDGFSLALKPNRTVIAWGANYSGQTNVPAGLNTAVAISAGGYHSLALRENGTVLAWGSNTVGETNVPTSITTISAISAGAYHNLALRNSGAPAITSQPWDQLVNSGANTSFTVLAAGNGTLVYQWRLFGTNLSGVNTRTCTRLNVQLVNAGPYTVVITNASGSVTSAVAWLDVIAGPPPLRLTALGYDANGFHLQLTGPPGPCFVEISTNLSSWTEILSNNIPQSGYLDLTDTTAVGVNARAYRAYQP